MKWYASGGKRFYVIEVRGHVIDPRAAKGGTKQYQSAAFAVLDRDWGHREMAVFGDHPGAQEASANVKAHDLARRLNREDECTT